MTAWAALGIVFGALLGTLLIGNAIVGILLGIVAGSSMVAGWMAFNITNR